MALKIVLQGLLLLSWFHICEPSVKCTSADGSGCRVSKDSTLRFFVLGDFGGQDEPPYTTEIQRQVAERINLESEKKNPNFYLTLGDNFYNGGVKNVDDPRFNATFESVYTYRTDPEGKPVPWYLLAGNHDHQSNIQAQIDYSKGLPVALLFHDLLVLPSDRANLRDRYLCGYKDKHGGFGLDEAHESLEWLENGLKKSSADYLFVAGHYPVYSAGKHGGSECIAEKLTGMLLKYKVSAYIAGHNHQLEHLKLTPTLAPRPNQRHPVVHLIVSGAAAKMEKTPLPLHVRPVTSKLDVKSLFSYPNAKSSSDGEDASKKGGYVFAEVDARRANFEFRDSDGTLMHSFDVEPRDRSDHAVEPIRAVIFPVVIKGRKQKARKGRKGRKG